MKAETDKMVKEAWREEIAAGIERVRQRRPLVHCISNIVTAGDCANLLLAAGASPTMAHHPQEVEEITQGCAALVCNLGATESYEAMQKAAVKSSECGHPIVIDPVGTGGSAFRRNYFKELCRQADITCIRGNASEIEALVTDSPTVTGVDAISAHETRDKITEAGKTAKTGETANADKIAEAEMAQMLARRHGCIVVVSGEVDVVTDGAAVYRIENGSPIMADITGTGCMLSALLSAHLAAAEAISGKTQIRGTGKLWACAAGVLAMGVCGELAAQSAEAEGGGTMRFRMHLIDGMYRLRAKEAAERAVFYEV